MKVGPRPGIARCAIYAGTKLIGHIIRPISNPDVYRAVFLDWSHQDAATYEEALKILGATE